MAFYPEGIQAQSSGLRGTSYPGSSQSVKSNPNGVATSSGPGRTFDTRRNPVGVEMNNATPFPRVAPSSQPWALLRNRFAVEHRRPN